MPVVMAMSLTTRTGISAAFCTMLLPVTPDFQLTVHPVMSSVPPDCKTSGALRV